MGWAKSIAGESERAQQRGSEERMRRQGADSGREKMNIERGIKEGRESMDGY